MHHISIEEVFELDTESIQQEYERLSTIFAQQSSSMTSLSESELREIRFIMETIEQELQERNQSDSLISALTSVSKPNDTSFEVPNYQRAHKDSPFEYSSLDDKKIEENKSQRNNTPSHSELYVPLQRTFSNIVNNMDKIDLVIKNVNHQSRPSRTKKQKTSTTNDEHVLNRKSVSSSSLRVSKSAGAHHRNTTVSRCKQRQIQSATSTIRKHTKRKIHDIAELHQVSKDNLVLDSNEVIVVATDSEQQQLPEETNDFKVSSDMGVTLLDHSNTQQELILIIEDVNDKDDESHQCTTMESIVVVDSLSVNSSSSNNNNSSSSEEYGTDVMETDPSISIQSMSREFEGAGSNIPSLDHLKEKEGYHQDCTCLLLNESSTDITNNTNDDYSCDPTSYMDGKIENEEIVASEDQVATSVESENSVLNAVIKSEDQSIPIQKIEEEEEDPLEKQTETNSSEHSQSMISDNSSIVSVQKVISVPREVIQHYTDYSPFFRSIYDIFNPFFNHFSGSLLKPTRNNYNNNSNRNTNNNSNSSIRIIEKDAKLYLKQYLEWLTHWNIQFFSKSSSSSSSSSNNQSLFKYFSVQGKQEVIDVVLDATEELSKGSTTELKLNSNSIVEQECTVLWKEVNCADEYPFWSLMWSWSSKPRDTDRNRLLIWQQVNHFPHSKHLTRKDLLKKHVNRYKKLPGKTGQEFNIVPISFNLPEDYVEFVDYFANKNNNNKDSESKNLWIMKPVGMSRGRGISLIHQISQVSYKSPVVIQKYIENPLLINGGRKFDLRLYVLVTRFSPLEAFVYKEGFARFASEKYTSDLSQLDNHFIHLTNTAIQENYYSYSNDKNNNNKYSIEEWKELLNMYDPNINFQVLWEQITGVIMKSLCCVEDDIGIEEDEYDWGTSNLFNTSSSASGSHSSHRSSSTSASSSHSLINSFELFGYDIMIDQDLKPWLIEVNASPSMERNNHRIDYIKKDLIRDTIALIDPLYYNTMELQKVLESKLKKYNTTTKPSHCSGGSRQKKWREQQELMNRDLTRVLNGKLPRPYGQMPRRMGQFERLAPSTRYNHICKMKRHL